jgi:hypothetical protein
MNDLELEIASLRISPPSVNVDERVAAVLNRGRTVTPSATIRVPVILTIATACLLAGTLAGYAGAALYAPDTGAERISTGSLGGTPISSDSGPVPSDGDSSLLTTHLNDTRFAVCQRCHQSADVIAAQMRQLRLVAQRKAAAWERETGDHFLLASHTADDRFVACRRCHVLESPVESM